MSIIQSLPRISLYSEFSATLEYSTSATEWGIAVVGANVNVGDGAKVNPKEMIDSDRVKEAE